MHTQKQRFLSVGYFCVFGVLAVGCADLGGDASGPSELEAAGLQVARVEPILPGRLSEIRMEGSGCPRDALGNPTWSIVLKGEVSDGTGKSSFTILFAQYELDLTETRSYLSKNCTIVIPLRSEANRRFAVTRFQHVGQAYLEEGVRFKHTASYSFAGTAGDPAMLKPLLKVEELRGPYDAPFAFHSGDLDPSILTEGAAWSDCGKELNLLLDSRMAVYNSSPRGTGLVTMQRIDGEDTGFTVEVAAKECDGT